MTRILIYLIAVNLERPKRYGVWPNKSELFRDVTHAYCESERGAFRRSAYRHVGCAQ
jgi:hypothetical protein